MTEHYLKLLLVLTVWLLWRSLRSAIVRCRVNLPGPRSAHLIFGNLKQFFDPNHGVSFHERLASYGTAVKIHGICGDEQIYISDPRALHHILVKEADMFEASNMFIQNNRLMFGYGLLSTCGARHKRQRKMLNPAFSAKHLRSLTPLFHNITKELRSKLEEKLAKKDDVSVDIFGWMSRVSLEIVGQAGMGYSFEVFDENVHNEYADCLRHLLPTLFTLKPYLQFIPLTVKLGPPAFRRFLINLLPSRRIKRLKEIVDRMDRASRRILELRKHAVKQGGDTVLKQVGDGKDIMSVLRSGQQSQDVDNTLPENELLAQITRVDVKTLTFAANDTTSSAMSRILHVLSLHPEAQDKLRDEVKSLKSDPDETSYDNVMALPYLDAVCRETLRLYPPAPFVQRTALREHVVPLMYPVKGSDGSTINEIPIAANQGIFVGIVAINKHRDVWGPDAEEWKPERWLNTLPSSVLDARIPGVYPHILTFMAGNRACIGFKFSELEMKIVIALLIQKFQFSPSDNEEIIWRMGSIQTPSTRGRDGQGPYLPMKVSMV
ncbi:cytochrome P450 [Rickenella mellea]|uniref:Cytochrome P450 n=1 Tax=Rickenella mellea TaxID=50990 RepID=A0A4Y7PMH1_9AGAM|nr:cytochrome P450 [Rickenella mellea]